MTRYRYLAHGLLTGDLICELPLTDVSYGRVLNGAGPLSASLVLPEPSTLEGRLLATDYINGTNPARVVIYVERDGQIVADAIVWDREYDTETRRLQINGAGMWSYFRRRRVLYDFNSGGVSGDQLAWAQFLLYVAQGYPGGDIGVTTGSETSGVQRVPSWSGQQAKKVAEAVEDLADSHHGFDFAIEVERVGDDFFRHFRCHYPRRGRTASKTELVFELGRNIISLSWPEDGSRVTNTMIGQGAGNGDTMITATAVDTGKLAEGYPLLEDVVSFKDTTNQDLLAAQTQAALGDVRTTAALPKLVVRGDVDPVLGSYLDGDDCRIRVQPDQDPRWPNGLEKYSRIVAWTASVPDEGGPETVTLSVQEVAA